MAGDTDALENPGKGDVRRRIEGMAAADIVPHEVRMKEKLMVSFAVFVSLFTATKTLPAHHGTAAYDDKITEIKQAMVTKFLWSNPHSLIDFDVKNANSQVVHWTCETAAPQALRLIGWSKASLEPGDVITVDMYVAKNGNPVGRLQKIVRADGTELHDTLLGGDAGGKTKYDPDGGK
jgi:hypothetical protein